MASGDILGRLGVEIVGDYSELQSDINSAAQVADAGAAKIAEAFVVPDLTTGMEASLGSLVDQILAAGTAADTASGQMALFGSDTATALSDVNQQLSLFDTNGIEATDTAFGSLAQSADSAVAPTQEAATAIVSAGDAGNEAEGGLSAMVEQLTLLGEALVITEGLKEFGVEALSAAATVQSVTVGLTALTGSAETADSIITSIKELAATEPFAFPEIAPTVQKMVAMGVAAQAIPGAMQAIADTAAATTNSFQSVANMFDRMAISGTVNARGLATLGIQVGTLAADMSQFGVSADASLKEVSAAFKDLDESQRVEVLEAALSKFAGTAVAEAQTIGGQWQIFKNQFEEVMIGVGDALTPVVSDILSFSKVVLGGVQSAVETFDKLPGPVKDVAVAIGLVAAAAVPLAGGLAAVGLAANALSGLPAIFTGIATSIGLMTAAEETTAGVAGTATIALEAESAARVADGVAATTAAGEIEAGAVASSASMVSLSSATRAAMSEAGVAVTGAGELVQGFTAAEAGAGVAAAGMAGPIGVAVVAIGALTLAAVSGRAELEKLDQVEQAVARNEIATPAQANQIDVLIKALKDYNAEAALAGKQVIKLPEFDPTVPDAVEKYAVALSHAAEKMGLLSTTAAQAKTDLYNLQAGGSVLIGTFNALEGATPGVVAAFNAVTFGVDKAKQALADAKAAVVLVDAAFKGSAEAATEHAAAVAKVEAAEKALDTALGITTASLKAHKDTLEAVDVSAKKITDDYLTASATFMKVKIAFDDGTASLVQLGIASENSDKAAAAYAKSIQAAGDQSHTAAAKVDDLATIIENGKSVLVPYADALNSAAKSTGDLTQATSDEYQAFVNGDEAALNLTDGITQLRGAVDQQTQSVGSSKDSWVFQNDQWVTAQSLTDSLAKSLPNLTDAMNALAGATEKAAVAQQTLDNAQSYGKAGKGSGAIKQNSNGTFTVGGQTYNADGSNTDPFGSSFFGITPDSGFAAGNSGFSGNTIGTGNSTAPASTAGGGSTSGAGSSGDGSVSLTDIARSLSSSDKGKISGFEARNQLPGFVQGSTAMATISINGSGPLAVDQVTADSIARAAQAGASAAQQWGILDGQNSLGDVLANTATTSGSAVAVIPEGMSTVSINGSAPMLVSSSVAQQMQEAAAAGASAAQQFGLLTGQTSLGSLLQNTARTVSVALNNGIPVTGPDFSPSAAIAPFYNSGPASVSGISSAAFTGAAGTSSTPIDVKTGLPETSTYTPSLGLPSSFIGNQSGAPTGPGMLTINLPNATIYGTQGAQMVAQEIVNALKTGAGQLRY